MYINKDKKKRTFKQYKVLKIDVHGRLLKKRRLFSSFYVLYSKFILNQFFKINRVFEQTTKKKKIDVILSKYLDKFVKFKRILVGIKRNKSVLQERFMYNDQSFREDEDIFRKDYVIKQRYQILSFNLLQRYGGGKSTRERSNISKFTVKKLFFNLYFSLTKHQYFSYLKRAFGRKGVYVNNFFNIIESRLDMIVYRSFSNLSKELIKQMILHKRIYVNNNKISYSSFLLKKNDMVSFFNYENLTSYDIFIHMYKYMLAQMVNINNNFFIFKYPNYILVDFNFLIILFLNDKFLSEEIPNFFNFDFKAYSKLKFK